MQIVKSKPTSPGRRFVVRIKNPDLYKGKPYAPKVVKKSKTGGRNNLGRITCRHIGGGHKQRYRIIDFKRDKNGIMCRVERIEYDPNRSANIALVLYMDGERRYIIAPNGVKTGDELHSGIESPIKAGNCLPISHIPIGSTIHLCGIKAWQRCSIST
jgi:large subunit ribosomal protein L2